jgi:hypothetical protein
VEFVIDASRHCGAVRVEIASRSRSVTDCSYSICRRLGARRAYDRPHEVEVICARDATGIHLWNDRCIEFHHCRTCGCTTHYEGVSDEPRRVVNARLMDIADIRGVPIRRFDEASSRRYLDDHPDRVVE